MGEPERHPHQPRRLGLGAVGELLGVPRLTVWWWCKTGQLNPTGVSGQTPWWTDTDVYQWALARERGNWSGRVPLSAWPSTYGATEFDKAVDLPGAVALRWHNTHGPVSLVWPLPGIPRPPSSYREWTRTLAPNGDGAVIVVAPGLNVRGPELRALLPALPDRDPYLVSWSSLAEVLRQRLPYWPPTLRDRHLIAAWTPDGDPTTAMPVPALDTAALLTLASTYPDGHPAARVLINLTRLAHTQAADNAAQDLQLIESTSAADTHLLVAARPRSVPDVDLDEVDATTRRAGWLDILAGTDDLSCRCVREVCRWDAGADLPFGNPEQIDVRESRWAFYWSKQLAPGQRTAAFEIIDADEPGDPLIDPETDAPVWRHLDGTFTAAMPQRLPAAAPLTELILAGPIWIRTADGKLYPAPRDSSTGISWGYHGSGPGTLALLIDALLTDINAKAPDNINGAPAGLEELFSRKLPDGTLLTRAQLEAARRGETVIIAVANPDDEDEDE